MFGLPVPCRGTYEASGVGYANNPNRMLLWRSTTATEVFVYETSDNSTLRGGTDPLPSGMNLVLSGTYERA